MDHSLFAVVLCPLQRICYHNAPAPQEHRGWGAGSGRPIHVGLCAASVQPGSNVSVLLQRRSFLYCCSCFFPCCFVLSFRKSASISCSGFYLEAWLVNDCIFVCRVACDDQTSSRVVLCKVYPSSLARQLGKVGVTEACLLAGRVHILRVTTRQIYLST